MEEIVWLNEMSKPSKKEYFNAESKELRGHGILKKTYLLRK